VLSRLRLRWPGAPYQTERGGGPSSRPRPRAPSGRGARSAPAAALIKYRKLEPGDCSSSLACTWPEEHDQLRDASALGTSPKRPLFVVMPSRAARFHELRGTARNEADVKIDRAQPGPHHSTSGAETASQAPHQSYGNKQLIRCSIARRRRLTRRTRLRDPRSVPGRPPCVSSCSLPTTLRSCFEFLGPWCTRSPGAATCPRCTSASATSASGPQRSIGGSRVRRLAKHSGPRRRQRDTRCGGNGALARRTQLADLGKLVGHKCPEPTGSFGLG
jgi:hypothetical protein